MSFGVRPVSLVDDREEMIDILNRSFGAGQEKRFDWRHIKNPVGEAWAWFGFDENKSTVATVAVYPRRMFVDGKLLVCGQVGGFAVDASHRSLGPAILLQRTTFEPVHSGAVAFCYDCPPHDRGMSTFVRLGMRPNCEIFRYALLLRSNEFLENRVGKSLWTKPLIAAANLFLGIRMPARKLPGLEITELQGLFGDEFSDLDRLVPSSGLIRASRAANLLNWRFREYPNVDEEYHILVARKGGELLGFVVLWMCDQRAYILDLFGVQLISIGPALLQAAIEVCRRKKSDSLHAYSSDDNELRPLLAGAGFRRREREARVVAYEHSNGRADKLLNHGLRWTFSRVEEML